MAPRWLKGRWRIMIQALSFQVGRVKKEAKTWRKLKKKNSIKIETRTARMESMRWPLKAEESRSTQRYVWRHIKDTRWTIGASRKTDNLPWSRFHFQSRNLSHHFPPWSTHSSQSVQWVKDRRRPTDLLTIGRCRPSSSLARLLSRMSRIEMEVFPFGSPWTRIHKQECWLYR